MEKAAHRRPALKGWSGCIALETSRKHHTMMEVTATWLSMCPAGSFEVRL
jgi:hypothetical protein